VSAIDEDDHEIEASRAPLLDHLIELRQRLIICAVALVAGFGLCFGFATQIYLFLLAPFVRASNLLAAQHAGHAHGSPFELLLVVTGFKAAPSIAGAVNMQFTEPLEFFFTKVKLAGFGAIVVTFPVLAYELYRFVAPGLYKRERRAFLPFLLASPFLFLLGASLVYFIMLPFVLWFALNQQILDSTQVTVHLVTKVSDYLTLVTSLLLAFGLFFQLPVVMALLGMSNIVTTKMLTSARRYAVVGVFVVAAVLTPPDPISMMTLALPGVLLYEISILCVWLIERRKDREAAAEAVG